MKVSDFASAVLVGGLLLAHPALAQVTDGGPSGQPPETAPEGSQWQDSYFPFARVGAYASVGGIYALENFDEDAPIQNGPLDISGDDAGGIDVRIGYRFFPHFSAEVDFQYYFNFGIKERITDVNDNFDGWSMTLNGKGYAMLGAIQPYGLVGVGGLVFTEKRRDDRGFMARLGGGIDVYLTDHLVVELEAAYVVPTDAIDDFQFATFGVSAQYRF